MTNLNYLLLQVLQEKLTKEQATKEINDYVINNDTKVNSTKELHSFLSKINKETLKQSGLCGNYQVFTDCIVLYATTTHDNEVKISKEYPNCDKIINGTIKTGGIKFNLRQLYNASQIAKNEAKTTFNLMFSDYSVKLSIKAVENAYKISGLKEGIIKVVEKNNRSPLFIYSYDEKQLVVITPCVPAPNNNDKDIEFYVCDNGRVSFEKTEKLDSIFVKVEKPKVEQPKTDPVKVIAKVRNINDKEQATSKQIAYLIMLTGKPVKEGLTKQEASKLITEIKIAKAKPITA